MDWQDPMVGSNVNSYSSTSSRLAAIIALNHLEQVPDMHPQAKYWIDHLKLIPHPEGGFFKEVFRSQDTIARAHLPCRYKEDHSFMTSIFFLVLGNRPALLHRVQSDELWVFLDGSSLTIHTIDQNGNYLPIVLGKDIAAGHVLQYVVPAGTWFGETVNDSNGYTLAACIVSPGFEYNDFELASRRTLTLQFPDLADLIEQLTLPEERER